MKELTVEQVAELRELAQRTRQLEADWRGLAERTADTGVGIVHSKIADAQHFLGLYIIDHALGIEGQPAPAQAQGDDALTPTPYPLPFHKFTPEPPTLIGEITRFHHRTGWEVDGE